MKIKIRQAPRPQKSWAYYILALAFTALQVALYLSSTVRITINTCKGWWL